MNTKRLPVRLAVVLLALVLLGGCLRQINIGYTDTTGDRPDRRGVAFDVHMGMQPDGGPVGMSASWRMKFTSAVKQGSVFAPAFYAIGCMDAFCGLARGGLDALHMGSVDGRFSVGGVSPFADAAVFFRFGNQQLFFLGAFSSVEYVVRVTSQPDEGMWSAGVTLGMTVQAD